MPKHHRTIGDAVGYAMAHNARLAAQHDAARQASGIDTASDTAQHPGALRGLLEHVRIDTTGRDITVDGKVVAAARQATGQADTEPDPTTADDPTPLRWGHGDIIHGDDNTVTVCLSGPDRKPYWLELDPERAQALRDDLAAPRTEPITEWRCAYCGLEVEDRGHPVIQEHSNWYPIWVHTPGGYTACDPQKGASSTRATPAVGWPAAAPADETEPLVHVGWWCWRGNNHGHLTSEACRSDNVPIHVPAEWADEMRAVIQHLTDDHAPGEDCTWVTPEEQAAETLAAADTVEDETR